MMDLKAGMTDEVKEIMSNPSMLLGYCICAELNRIGILSNKEVKNVVDMFGDKLDKTGDFNKSQIGAILIPLIVISDDELENTLRELVKGLEKEK